jgi:S-adenosylmethionine synthetase
MPGLFSSHPLIGVDFAREYGYSPSRTHPDKVADFIADRLVDAALTQDRHASTRFRVIVTGDDVFVHGEASVGAPAERAQVVHTALVDSWGEVRAARCTVTDLVRTLRGSAQGSASRLPSSPESGIVVGHATSDSPEHLSRATVAAHALMRRFDAAPADTSAHPSIQSVRVSYDREGERRAPSSVRLIHSPHASVGPEFVAHLRKVVLPEVLGADGGAEVLSSLAITIAPGADEHEVGGISGRCEVTDTYGAHVAVPSAPMVGRDPWRVERAGAYHARAVAREVLRMGLAQEATIKVVYASGHEEPLRLQIVTRGRQEPRWAESFVQAFDFRIPAIVECLQLTRPHHADGVHHGRFGVASRLGEQWPLAR